MNINISAELIKLLKPDLEKFLENAANKSKRDPRYQILLKQRKLVQING